MLFYIFNDRFGQGVVVIFIFKGLLKRISWPIKHIIKGIDISALFRELSSLISEILYQVCWVVVHLAGLVPRQFAEML